jgi:hypothetical protein
MSPHRPNYAESPDQILKRLDYLDLHGELVSLYHWNYLCY